MMWRRKAGSMWRRRVGSKRTALYYPTITVPTGPWLRQALLYWDEIASIVPQSLDGTALTAYTPDIEYLKKVGEFRPIRPQTFIEEQPQVSKVVEFQIEIRRIVECEEFQSLLGPERHWVIDSRIHQTKFHQSTYDYLVQKGLAKHIRHEDRHPRPHLFERRTALLYMALLAKYLADIDPHLTVPSTDRWEYRDLIYLTGADPSGFACTEVLCRNILPVPREGVPLSDIIDFKHRRRAELLRFRMQIDQFEKDLASAESVAEARDVGIRFTESVERGVAELIEILDDAHILTTFSSLRSLVSVKSPLFWPAVGLLAGKVTKVADIPIEWSIAGLGVIGAIEIGYQLVNRRNEQRAKLRESAFSYLYHAETLT